MKGQTPAGGSQTGDTELLPHHDDFAWKLLSGMWRAKLVITECPSPHSNSKVTREKIALAFKVDMFRKLDVPVYY